MHRALNELLEINYAEESDKLTHIFTDKDVLLLRNEHMKNKIIHMQTGAKVKFRKKEKISLYKYASQVTVKTGALGVASEIGYVNSDGESPKLAVPKKNIDVKVQGYINNRIFESFLNMYLDQFNGNFYVNSSYLLKDKYVFFKVLLDSKGSNIFRGMEREVKLRWSEKFEKLVSWSRVSYELLSSEFTDEEIKSLFSFNILVYPNLKTSNNFSWIYDFDCSDIKISHYILSIRDIISSMDSQNLLQTDSLRKMDNAMNAICKYFDVDHLNLPYFTLDSYLDNSNSNLDKESESVISMQSTFTELSKFMSIFDASKKVEELCQEYMTEHFPDGIRVKNFNELDSFFNELAHHVFTKINLGGLRSGFFEGEFPIIKKVISDIEEKEKFENTVIILKNDLRTYLNLGKNNRYNFSNSYALFIQQYNSVFVVNHIYKGYGIFNRRYRSNFPTEKFENNYGHARLLDMPYHFGFNANSRSCEKVFDPLNQTRGYHELGISYPEILIKPDESKKNLRFFLQKEEVFLSFLGSMTPMVLPKTLAMFNSINLTGGMYFDLGDLILREKYQQNSSLNKYTASRIAFSTENLIIARKKVLLRSNEVLGQLSKYNDNVSKILYLKEIINLDFEFYIREFSVDMNFKNKFEKPIFVNLGSLMSIDVLVNYIQSIDWFVAEEVSPQLVPDNSLVEYIVETKEGEVVEDVESKKHS